MIGDYIDILSGYAFKSELFNNLGKGTPIVRIRDVGKEFSTTYFDGDYPEEYVLENGDFLIGMDGDFRLAEWKGGKALLNQRVCKIIPNEDKINARYLFFMLPRELQRIEDSTSFATVKHLSVKKIKKIKIPLPPLPTQKKIAAILDEADRIRQLSKQLIKKYDELTQSLFLDIFGDPVTNPMGWEKVKLKEVCNKITDGTHHSPEPKNQGYPYVTAKHVKPFSLEFDKKKTFISESDHNEIFKRCSPEFGDILYIKDGATTGIACINTFTEPISLLSSLALLKLKDGIIINYYLMYWLNHEGIKTRLISEFMSGAAIQRYTLKKINSFVITNPPITLQNQFAERIQAIEAQKAQAQLALQKTEELFNSLLQRAFKGELV